MPIYEYQCENCGKKFDVMATLTEKEAGLNPVCPKCGSQRARQVLGRFTLLTSSKASDDFGADDETSSDSGMDNDDDSGFDEYGDEDLDTLEGSGDLDDI